MSFDIDKISLQAWDDLMRTQVGNQPDAALYLSETLDLKTQSTGFLSSLTEAELDRVRDAGRRMTIAEGDPVFSQGETHHGVFLIESGSVKTFYTGPTGREITLAYWPEGHFVGGPEIFGGGVHIWSGVAATDCKVLFVRGSDLRRLIQEIPALAVGIVEGLVAKGKCYSALIHMLGTRSVSQRLAHLILILGDLYGVETDAGFVVGRTFTHEELANVVGSTRQWVTANLDRLAKRDFVAIRDRRLVILDKSGLEDLAGY